eukprot:1147623-Pelagomonas_calceolata.AAC.5
MHPKYHSGQGMELSLLHDPPPLHCAHSCRYPMFIQNVTEDEAWNHPYNMTNPSFCPPGLCYNATTGEKTCNVVMHAWTTIFNGIHKQNMSRGATLQKL